MRIRSQCDRVHPMPVIIGPMTVRYLSSSEFAFRIGVRDDTLNKYKLPPPDVLVGRVRGWKAETIDLWNMNRPGRGNRTRKPPPARIAS
jgi:hypothetical protein